ncbi:MAG: GGDEF domain-containing protein [Patescibacteria group bacterium]|jgi:diguanylate cyclase (GGDEF)-like protein
MNRKNDSVICLSAIALIGIAATAILTVENRRLASLLEEAATDHLTGIPTRRHLMRSLKRLEMGGVRSLPLAVLVIDANGLKETNDLHGHKAGDRLLQVIAEIIIENVRPNDIFGRLGGDEFIIVLPNTDLDGAELVAKRLQTACASSYFKYPVSVSIGIAVREDLSKPIDKIIHEADQEMYKAKAAYKKAHV